VSLRVQLVLEGNLEKFSKDVQAKLAFVTRYAVETYAKKLQLALREDTRGAGLGEGVANAWRLNIYDAASGSPAAMVYSKAPMIVRAFGQDTTITAHEGHLYLAIPTENVPRLGNRRMTPVDVEARFNQDLIFIPSGHGTVLAFVNVIPAKSGHGFRAPTKGRLAQGRHTQMVLMFVMVQQVHLRKRLNWPELFADAKEGFETYLAETVADALAED
jgi:hypothetical protein